MRVGILKKAEVELPKLHLDTVSFESELGIWQGGFLQRAYDPKISYSE